MSSSSLPMPYTIHVVLGGAPGVGKSTAIAKLKEMRPDIHVNTETLPVLVRKCLARLYRKEGHPTETALKVQIGLLARTILDSFELAKEPGIHVSERDHEDAEVFISQMKQFGFLDDEARELLCDLISALKRTDPRDDVFRILRARGRGEDREGIHTRPENGPSQQARWMGLLRGRDQASRTRCRGHPG